MIDFYVALQYMINFIRVFVNNCENSLQGVLAKANSTSVVLGY